uniref:Replication-associated protein n=1 Tax=Ficedula parva Genomoviridae sp. TaxID=2814952 RepID=A0A8A4XCD2_9VIRU
MIVLVFIGPFLTLLMSDFRCNARFFLLTYAQCGELDGWSVMEHLSQLGAECVIGRELHADGGIHLHCFVDFGEKFRGRGVQIFDVEDRHPNIETVGRTPWKAYDYAIKDGDVICGGADRPIETSNVGTTSHDKWSQIVSATCRAEFWELVLRLDPKAAAVNYSALAKFCDWRFAPIVEPYSTPAGITFVMAEFDGRDQWLAQANLGGVRTGKVSHTALISDGVI